MTEFGGLWADAVEMGLISWILAEERQVGGCWRSSSMNETLNDAAPGALSGIGDSAQVVELGDRRGVK